MAKYIISIDQSTQGTKALLFDETGSIMRRTDRPHRQIINEKGWVSHDPEEIYNNVLLDVEKLDEKHQRETRILYKSDLLFYLKIYTTLHVEAKLPEYNLFCIDEGQDLHKADYDFLHQLYPKARFNIFGDTQQVLHTACGIRNWAR